MSTRFCNFVQQLDNHYNNSGGITTPQFLREFRQNESLQGNIRLYVRLRDVFQPQPDPFGRQGRSDTENQPLASTLDYKVLYQNITFFIIIVFLYNKS
jgi:hypothetical protein